MEERKTTSTRLKLSLVIALVLCATPVRPAEILTVAKTGSGTGTVTSSPAGINCGVACSASFAKNSKVKLFTTPANGSELGGWSGTMDCLDGCVTMTESMTCTVAVDFCTVANAVTVHSLSVGDRQTHHACNSLTVGPSVTVTGSGEADFIAGNDVTVVPPFEVQAGGSLTLGLGPARWTAKSGKLGTAPPGSPNDTGQDTYRIHVLSASTLLEITAAPDPNGDPEIYFYAPGTGGAGATNLLTNTPFGLDAAGIGANESASITVAAAGVYTLAIEDSRIAANQVAALYTLVVESPLAIGPLKPAVNEGPESD